jgi:hypothetical protein
MKLITHILIILLLCCTWGCAPTPPQIIEGVVTGVECIPQPSGVPNLMVLRFEDGRVILHAGWLNSITIGKNYRFTIRHGYWENFDEIK